MNKKTFVTLMSVSLLVVVFNIIVAIWCALDDRWFFTVGCLLSVLYMVVIMTKYYKKYFKVKQWQKASGELARTP